MEDGFDISISNVKSVHIERLSKEAVKVNVFLKDRKIRVLTIGSGSEIIIKEEEI